jgi:hypothetical protein
VAASAGKFARFQNTDVEDALGVPDAVHVHIVEQRDAAASAEEAHGGVGMQAGLGLQRGDAAGNTATTLAP